MYFKKDNQWHNKHAANEPSFSLIYTNWFVFYEHMYTGSSLLRNTAYILYNWTWLRQTTEEIDSPVNATKQQVQAGFRENLLINIQKQPTESTLCVKKNNAANAATVFVCIA